LRLRQIHNGVFLRFNKATLNMLRSVNTYVTYGTPNVKAVRELVYKRGFANVKKQRIAITDNSVIQKELGADNVICTEDIVHELMTCGKGFGKVSKFLWPFKLNSPSGGFSKKRISFIEGGQYVFFSNVLRCFVATVSACVFALPSMYFCNTLAGTATARRSSASLSTA
jgi:large subunit ribosomal protein L7e